MAPSKSHDLPLFDEDGNVLPEDAGVVGAVVSKPPRRSHETRIRPRALIVFGLAMVLAAVAFAGARSYRDLAVARQRLSELDAMTEAAEQRITALEHRLDQLQDDPLTLERLAREQLGMAAPDDILIVLPQP